MSETVQPLTGDRQLANSKGTATRDRPSLRAIVLLNDGAGRLSQDRDRPVQDIVASELSAAGIEAEIRLVSGSDLQAAAETAARSDVDVVIAGGGDGTLSTVAGALVGTGMPLGVLPQGTLNHFAKDLGIPLEVAEAVRTIAARNVADVDVGQVNDRVFINNSSIGLYPLMVRDRETRQNRDGHGKWTAMLLAMVRVFRLFPLVKVRLTTEGGALLLKTPLVFVGNNCYQLDLLNIGSRACVNKGELSLYVATARTRWGMIKLTVRAMLGRLEQSRDFETFSVTNCRIETRRRRTHVAVDGEVLRLETPLDYRVRPGLLKVCLPPKDWETQPAASPGRTSA
ncbi:MAG: NAD(+)/NADH kinase [Planctomycetaceae bacterium]|nr:NAD(+)/NADH kinase [Planctomycetaceae bacterium]